MNKQETAMDLLAQVEKRKSEIELRWGKDRFPNLMDSDLKVRYMQMVDKFANAKATRNYLVIRTIAEGMLRAYDKCEENIRLREHEELTSDVWAYTYKDKKFILVRDKAFYEKAVDMAKKDNSTHSVWFIDELMDLIPEGLLTSTNLIKNNFPGAKVI
tara:strand:- start:1248 stop:1721 length:474 start_codon:yes stop_codon:yes gene_type:complete